VLGDIIAQLDRPGIAMRVLGSLDPELAAVIGMRAHTASMETADFVAGAVRSFVDDADDDLWFQLLTVIRKADDPALAAVQTILKWTVTGSQGPM
jgi:hypothetical protein